MSTRTTYFGPRVSFRTSLSDAGPVHVYGDSNSTLEWDGPIIFGADGSSLRQIVKSSISISFPNLAGHDSSTTTAGITALTADAVVLAIQPESAWSGAYYDIDLEAKPSAASVLEIAARNSAVTAVDPDALTFDVVWADFS